MSDGPATGSGAPSTTRPGFVEGEVRLIGERWSPRVHELKDFLSRSRVRYRWLDIENDPRAREVLERELPGVDRLPIVLFPDGTVLVDPDVRAVAEKLGLETTPNASRYDLIVVGGGPAGLSAAIYAGSEGLRTVVVEQNVPGGQATYSASIENYPGFPEGLTGGELARRTVQQAERFGVEILVTRRAMRLRADGELRHVAIDDGTELESYAVLLSMGVSFRWLDVPGCPQLVGAGVYYGSAVAEATACVAQDIYILGGGNSAAQAALLLAQYARRVVILTHDDSIEQAMSNYLVERIRRTPNIIVRTSSTIAAVEGTDHLEWVTIESLKTGERERVRADGLFIFIGARPRTDWLGDLVARDENGFVLTAEELRRGDPERDGWPLEREPFPLETSTPGVFVAGDVRRDAVRRLTAAAGEGAMAVQFVHRHRAAMRDAGGARAQERSPANAQRA